MAIDQSNQTVSIVADNCFFEGGIKEFETKLNEIISGYNIKRKLYKIPLDIQTDQPIPKEIRETFPVIAFEYCNFTIIYSLVERKIIITSNKWELLDIDLLKQLFNDLISLKIQDIENVGVNFIADCCTHKKRLSILNTKINDTTVSNWSKNKGFELTIPIELKEFQCFATYKILKSSGGKQEDGTFKEYVYKISTNYNFNISYLGFDLIKRLRTVRKINVYINKLYQDFITKCMEITRL